MYNDRYWFSDPSGSISLFNVTATGNLASDVGSVVYSYGSDLQVNSLYVVYCSPRLADILLVIDKPLVIMQE